MCSQNKRKSCQLGWDRGLAKYSPSSQVLFSPVKTSEVNLTQISNPDTVENVVDLYLWVLNMSEQLHYDNAFLLLSSVKNDKDKVVSVLRRNYYLDIDFFNKLENLTILGKGTYGTVYSCVDPKTGMMFAFKHLTTPIKEYIDNATNLLDYLVERNASIRATDSTFVIKFYYSIQFKEPGSLLLFFEFCIGDLNKYIHHIEYNNLTEISQMMDQNEEESIQKLYSGLSDEFEVSLVYVFEMFCALDFLVKCNLIHQDIKPANIMVSSTMHLKIGDMGLTYRTRMIERETNQLLINQADLNNKEDLEGILQGSLHYQDFEQQMQILEMDFEDDFYDVIDNKRKFNAPNISMKEDDVEPMFLTDTWSAGIIAIKLLLRGFEIFNPIYSHKDVLQTVPKDNFTIFLIHVVARQFLYTNYVYNGLSNAGGACHKELMSFLALIFKPRLARCMSFTKEKIIYLFARKMKMKYLDLDKFENIKSFSERNFSRNTICLRQIPEKFRAIYSNSDKPAFKSFHDFAVGQEGEERMINFSPGVTMNNFS